MSFVSKSKWSKSFSDGQNPHYKIIFIYYIIVSKIQFQIHFDHFDFDHFDTVNGDCLMSVDSFCLFPDVVDSRFTGVDKDEVCYT